MKRTRFALLVELAVGAAALGWLVLSFLESRAVYLPNVPWIVILALVALAGVVFWEGWLVRSYQRGRKPDLDALRAARAFVLGKAAALTGSLLVGWYASQFLVVLGDLSIDARRTKGVDALYAAAAALVLAVVGVVVERFCQLPPDDGNAAKDRARRPDPEADASS
jgi:hypothetical protein